MFGTWKYDPETDEVQSLRNAFDPVTARSSSHQACDRCHEKKLRCSGDKTGCDRCRSNNLRCEYTRSGSKSSRKGKKSSKEDSGASSSSSRRGGSSSKKSSSSSSSSSSRHKHSRGHSSRGAPPGDETGVLGQFDFSSLSPEDGFDFSEGADPYASASGSGAAGGYAVPVSSAAASQSYMQHQHQHQGASDAGYQQSWDEYSQQYMAAYGQPPPHPGYESGDWGHYDYSHHQ
ncbi:hypothetical protein B0T10DRAFT_488022 [Thelonectria olida]|uniref:Zn(2)-C6 fungal-type domain-containing protein n=1 Tax=Thelonectria olida TaxID=1576542 RepID=A0A9P8W4C1_9HYPO|nr:hypothetical protein B0T10DRAFT_488022 [Thelonectria olida]